MGSTIYLRNRHGRVVEVDQSRVRDLLRTGQYNTVPREAAQTTRAPRPAPLPAPAPIPEPEPEASPEEAETPEPEAKTTPKKK